MIGRHRSAWVLVFTIGALLRGSLLASPGFEADLGHFARWAFAAADPGLGEFGRSVSCNYMPAYLYVLGALGWLASAAGWGAEDEAFRLVLRVPSNLLDLLFAIVLYRAGSRWAKRAAAGTQAAGTQVAGTHAAGAGTKAPSPIGLALFGLFWANPALAYDASAWGQVDGILVGLTTLALVAAVERRHGAAGLLFGVALMFKLQAVLWAPVLFGYLAWDALAGSAPRAGSDRDPERSSRWGGVLRFFLGCAGAVVVLNLPFVFAGNALYAFRVASESVGWHPLASLGALNLWWLVLDDPGGTWDGFRWLLGPTYKQVGLLLSGGVGLFLAAWAGLELRRHRHRLRSPYPERSGPAESHSRSGVVPSGVVESRLRYGAIAALFLSLGFYLFPTQMHERYAIFALGPLALLASVDRRWQPVWVLWTLGALWAMAAALAHMHPGSAIVPASWVRLGGSWPVAIATGNLAVWLGVLLALTRHWRRAWTWSLLVLPLVVGTWVARQQLEDTGVPLSQIRPEASRQGWRNLHHDVSVTNGPLRVGGETFETGLGTHAPSEIVYRLGGAFTRMSGACGLDDAGARGNQARFVIVTDDVAAFDSGALRGPAPAIPFEIPVAGVRTLRLLVDPTDDGQHFDHADWVDVRLYR